MYTALDYLFITQNKKIINASFNPSSFFTLSYEPKEVQLGNQRHDEHPAGKSHALCHWLSDKK